MKASILFIMNGIGAVGGLPGVSGGEVRWIEIAKRWQETGHEIHVFTPEPGVELCEKLGLEATFHVSRVPNQYSAGTYLLRFMKSIFIPKTLRNFRGVVYSTTEHAYDVLPALRIKGNRNESIWVAVVHWVAPPKRKGTSLFNSLLFFFNQRLGFSLIKKRADIVLAVSRNTAEHLSQTGFKRKTFPVIAGVNFQEIRKTALRVNTKKYDAVFMKRLDGTKGVFDLIEIWKDVVHAKPKATLGMIGLGSHETMTRLHKMVEAYGIIGNVDFLGPIYDFNAKISALASSKLLVLPSYEENWAIVIGEALATGIPVVCYSLPEIRTVWYDNVIWIPKGDKKKFANKVIEFLDDAEARNRLSETGIRFIKRYNWHEIADEEMKLILSVNRHVD